MVDSVTITTPNEETSKEHEEAMIAKVDGDKQPEDNQDTDENKSEERPEWLPEKFKTAEDMAKSYAELEKKLSGGASDSKEEAAKDTAEDDAREVADKAGLDFDALTTEYETNGVLSEETYKNIESKGIPRAMVDSFIAGQESINANTRTEMFASVGGEETYSDMMEWAGTNLNAQEIESYNKVMGSGDQNQIKLAVAGLHSRYTASEGSNPNLMSGDTSANAGSKFESVAQITAAMRDPRYKTDAAFRKEVEQKLARSSVI